MNISLAPSFFCNFRCSWCYLSVDQLKDKTLLSLDILDKKLQEAGPITHIDIYGGEPGLLPTDYVEQMLNVISKHTKSINVISNFFIVPTWFSRQDITVSVSYDWTQRQHHEKVLNNIISFDKSIPLLMLATEELCKIDPLEISTVLNSIGNIRSLEIKPYSTNQFNQYDMNWRTFEQWIKRWLELDLNFELVNQQLLKNSVDKKYNAFSDNHLYIGPDGYFYVLDFDDNDREYFKIINSIEDYNVWVAKEKHMVENNKFCSQCQWKGHCLTEHYRHVTSLEYSCNGFKELLDWYAGLEN